MIDKLEGLPALSASWIAPLAAVDPELHAELAASIVIEHASESVNAVLPAAEAAAAMLSVVDLRGKEIGAFRFAPATCATAVDRIVQYDRAVRARFEANTELVFVGDYGDGMIFLLPQGFGLVDVSNQPPRIGPLAPSFDAFIVAQANAFEAYKAIIVKHNDDQAFRAAAATCAALPAFRNTDVATIFDAQLRA